MGLLGRARAMLMTICLRAAAVSGPRFPPRDSWAQRRAWCSPLWQRSSEGPPSFTLKQRQVQSPMRDCRIAALPGNRTVLDALAASPASLYSKRGGTYPLSRVEETSNRACPLSQVEDTLNRV